MEKNRTDKSLNGNCYIPLNHCPLGISSAVATLSPPRLGLPILGQRNQIRPQKMDPISASSDLSLHSLRSSSGKAQIVPGKANRGVIDWVHMPGQATRSTATGEHKASQKITHEHPDELYIILQLSDTMPNFDPLEPHQ
ncbi:hypothetical protein CDL15_Pgr026821 [Punica granatum]|uniref:Uncharacterized protein n=1 Tax=Punica granatum TaxID=22663 RepID=A0A218WLJ3_PUNGR|nr:hypothetical protein CDL15_Pgr026821 [Punica granatum]PKI63401.1 hypothetical protein CRG98_016206 [Punica granatum]